MKFRNIYHIKDKFMYRSVTTIVAIIAALVVVFAAPGVASAVGTLYEEDFEGAGTVTTDFGYLKVLFGGDNPVGTSANLTTRAALAPSPMSAAVGRVPLTTPIPSFSVESILSFSMDLFVTGGDNWVGLANATPCCNEHGLFIGGNGGRWRMDARFLDSFAGEINLGTPTSAGFGTPVTAQVTIDADATGSELSVLIFDRANPSTVHINDTYALTAQDLTKIEGFTTFSIQQINQSGVEVDNIRVTSGVIPEPTSLVLLAWGLIGLVACGRRRLR